MMPKGVEHRGCAAQVLVFVLNAFRHHRNSHSRESVLVVSCFACSTPFGIIGILTICQKESQKVENGCSTPFGIIGILTSGTFTTTAANESAQRLSASSEFSRRLFCHSAVERNVLNAFRHHRNSHVRVDGIYV